MIRDADCEPAEIHASNPRAARRDRNEEESMEEMRQGKVRRTDGTAAPQLGTLPCASGIVPQSIRREDEERQHGQDDLAEYESTWDVEFRLNPCPLIQMTAEEIRDQDAELGIDSSWYRDADTPYKHLTAVVDVPQGSLQHAADDIEPAAHADDPPQDGTHAHRRHGGSCEVFSHN